MKKFYNLNKFLNYIIKKKQEFYYFIIAVGKPQLIIYIFIYIT